MKKFLVFIIVIILFALAAMLVLSVTQQDVQIAFQNTIQWIASFCKRLFEALRVAFSHG